MLEKEKILTKLRIKPREAIFREVFEKIPSTEINKKTNQLVDKSLVLYFAGPKSFTGEGE